MVSVRLIPLCECGALCSLRRGGAIVDKATVASAHVEAPHQGCTISRFQPFDQDYGLIGGESVLEL